VKCHTDSLLFSNDPGLGRGRPSLSTPSVVEAASAKDVPAAARTYLSLGFSVIPLRGKVPRVKWRVYQKQKPTQAEIFGWIERGLFQNVGIVCGNVSGNLVVVDFDVPRIYRDFCTYFPALSQTYTVATGGGGWHIYLQVENLPLSLRRPGVELRADGHQVAAPPSIHPNGTPYKVYLSQEIQLATDLEQVVTWMRSTRTSTGSVHLDPHRRKAAGHPPINPALVAAIAGYFSDQGYRQKGDWLNGPCIYPERHANHDLHRSFGFNRRSGYGYCFVCGSMLAKDIAQQLLIDPTTLGGVVVSPHEKEFKNVPSQ